MNASKPAIYSHRAQGGMDVNKQTLQKAQTGEMRIRSHGGQRPLPKSPAATLLRTSEQPSILMRATPRDEKTGFFMPRSRPESKRRQRAPLTARPRARVRSAREVPAWAKDAAIQTAVCLVVFAVVWTLAQRNEPVAQTFSDGVRSAITTRVDIDRALGKLKFVSDILPEAAFVFNNQEEVALALPCTGGVARSFSDDYSGVLLRGAKSVCAAASGEVTDVSEVDGRWSMRIVHPGGVETVYAALSKVYAVEGDAVRAGDLIGSGTAVNGEPLVYFEVDIGGKAIDPMSRILRPK